MADYAVVATKIVDPVTTSQEAFVDASGHLQVDLAASSATVTVAAHDVTNAGTFAVQEDGAALTALQLIDDIVYTDDTSTHATGTSKGALFMAAATPTDTAVGANDIGAVAMSLDRRLHVDADITASVALDVSAATVTVDLGANNDVTTEFAGSTAVAAMADDDANPTVLPIGAYLMGFDAGAANWNRVEVDDVGHLQVDVLSGGGADTPTSPVATYNTTASLAAAGEANHDTADFGSATKKLSKVIVSSSVAFKARVMSVDNDVETVLGAIFGQAGDTKEFAARHRDYFSTTFTATANFEGFRVEITNLDTSQAADVHSVIMYED